jgi:hypothetical protein
MEQSYEVESTIFLPVLSTCFICKSLRDGISSWFRLARNEIGGCISRHGESLIFVGINFHRDDDRDCRRTILKLKV